MCLRVRLYSRGILKTQSNSVPIKASPFTPIHNLKCQLGPDAMLLCFFFLLFSFTFVSPSSTDFFQHFLLARGSEDILSYLTCLPYLEWSSLCNRAWIFALVAIAVFYPFALPAFESKAGAAYTHLSLAFKKLHFFLQLKNMFKYLAPIFTAVWHL